MKRICWFFVILAVLLLILSTAAALKETDRMKQIEEFTILSSASDTEHLYKGKSTLPTSLTVIGEEAFEGTALEAVSLPESVVSVGNNAFAGNENLVMVSFPDSLSDLQGNPFSGSPHITLFGSEKSTGRNWARSHGIRYLVEIRFSSINETFQVAFVFIQRYAAEKVLDISTGKVYQQPKQIRKGRSDGELKAAALSGGAVALYIQSRYFP